MTLFKGSASHKTKGVKRAERGGGGGWVGKTKGVKRVGWVGKTKWVKREGRVGWGVGFPLKEVSCLTLWLAVLP